MVQSQPGASEWLRQGLDSGSFEDLRFLVISCSVLGVIFVRRPDLNQPGKSEQYSFLWSRDRLD